MLWPFGHLDELWFLLVATTHLSTMLQSSPICPEIFASQSNGLMFCTMATKTSKGLMHFGQYIYAMSDQLHNYTSIALSARDSTQVKHVAIKKVG